MANKTLFKTSRGKMAPAADTFNLAGGAAYAVSAEHALAQFAVTGCLNSTFYASDERQLETVKSLVKSCDPEFVARVALYARRKAHMKDLPALLCAVLASRSPALLEKVFDRVIDDARMLRNFVQIVRSGVTGRKSLGSLPKRLVRKWLAGRTEEQLFMMSVGNSPSLADVVKMVHPKPATSERGAMYAYLIGKAHDKGLLPEVVRKYEAFKGWPQGDAPEVPMQMLTNLELTRDHWKQIAMRSGWQATRMNLNAFARHGVFGGPGENVKRAIAERLSNRELIGKARVFPYQLMVAYTQADPTVPAEVRESLQDAMEVAIGNVPEIDGKAYVFPDVSGSMHSPVTGQRGGGTSSVRCIDVAALVAAAVLRKNPRAEVIPFSDNVVDCQLNPRDSVMGNAKKLAGLPSGGTNCSAPLAKLNGRRAQGDLVIYVSDNESWMDSAGWRSGRATETMQQWEAFKQRNPHAKLVCIDLTPNATTQAKERDDVLNVGGFSDQVFEVIASFARGGLTKDHWVGVIQGTEL